MAATNRNREVFNEIAESWYHRRHWSRFTKELQDIALRWKKGKLLNIGCAHGPDFPPFKNDFELWGMDFSNEMIKLAQRYATKFNFEVNLTVADAVALPYADAAFDWVIAIATYHHIQGNEQRLQAFHELRRILKPEGEAFITLWNQWQPMLWLKGKEANIRWKLRGENLYRYYYFFSYSELRRLLIKSGFEVLDIFPEKSYHFPLKSFSRNICALIRKG